MSKSTASDISALIKKQIKEFNSQITNNEVGEVITVGDGVASVYGLKKVQYGELLKFDTPEPVSGLAFNLEDETVGVVILGDDTLVTEGTTVFSTNKVISVPVGDELIGRVVNGLGQPIDGKNQFQNAHLKSIFVPAPPVMSRSEVNQPLETGILVVDSMIPIGKGQRELIIGDRQTGKTAIAIDAIINQKGKNVLCIYVAIGQKNSSVAQIVSKLKSVGAMEYTTIVSSSASELAPLQYIAPYAAVTMAEEWMNSGKHVLIIYDDLSKHAVAYRTLSLLLRRPPGREAYPGDIFFQHSYLLERAAKLSDELGGGSITALPIIETQAGDISAYIPTNVISITDGQIFTKESLFNSGQRPAVDIGFSVSRVGSAAQEKSMKKVVSSLKLELAQFREMEAFAQFGSDLDDYTKKILSHGSKVYELLKQNQYSPISVEDQVIILSAIKEKNIANVPFEHILSYRKKLINFMNSDSQGIKMKNMLLEKKDFVGDTYEELKKLISTFTESFIATLPITKAKNK